MNTLTALFLVSAIFGVVVMRNCCDYPVLHSIKSANVSKAAFKCSEPIHITCVKKGDYIATAFIYNYTKGDKHISTGMEGNHVDLDIVCDPSARLWRNAKPKGSKLYKSYGCTYMTEKGIWVIE